MTISRKHVGDREPGDLNAYRTDACRCYTCSGAWAAYVKRRKHSNWKPFADAQPIRDHLAYLSANGIGLRQVEKLTGIARQTLQTINRGTPRRPPNTRVRTDLAEKILAVRPGIDIIGDGAFLDSTGTYRRLRALVALGFPAADLVRRLGGDRCLRLETPPRFVKGSYARAVQRLYDELWNADPIALGLRANEVTRALNRATAAGWPLPAEWDDDEIDNPNAQPRLARRTEGGDERTVTEAEVDDVRWLLRTVAVDVGTERGREYAAARLGIKPDRLEYIVTRKIPKLEQAAQRDRGELVAA